MERNRSNLFGLSLVNTLGWDVRQDHVGPLGLYNTENRERISTTREDDVRETSGAIYGESQGQLTPWLRAITGLRVERFDYRVASSLVANSGSRSASIGLPRVSLVAGPWRETEFFVNAGEGFHSNDARGTTEHIDPTTGDPADPVTPLVRGIGAEVGMQTERVPHLQSSLSVWTLHLRSELVFAGDPGATEASRPSRRVGVEWSNHYAPTRHRLVDLDLATTRARFTDDDPVGKFIPEALQATAAAGVTARDIGPWTASLFARYLGPRPLIESDSVRSPSTTLLNTQIAYQFVKGVGLRFDVFNLLDANAHDITYYYASRLRGEAASGVVDVHFHPVERRSFRIGLTTGL